MINIYHLKLCIIFIVKKAAGCIMVINIADRIKYLRDKYEITQTYLAKRLGISRSAVNSWEMGLSLPSLANIVEMKKIFNVSIDYILGMDSQVTLDITDLDNEEREIVFKLVDCLKKRDGKTE